MKIIDMVINEITDINDYTSAYKEAKARVKEYQEKGINAEMTIGLDTIKIWKK